MEEIKKQRGGYRKGSGRKKRSESMTKRTIHFTDELWDTIHRKNTGISRNQFIIEAVIGKITTRLM